MGTLGRGEDGRGGNSGERMRVNGKGRGGGERRRGNGREGLLCPR